MAYVSYDERKTAQAAAYMLHLAGGSLPLIKLLKLLYLAERGSLQRYGEPITGDRLVAMEHGPVLSRTLNHMNGSIMSSENGWDTWISDRANHNLALRDPSTVRGPGDLRALSESDVEILDEVWRDFGHFRKFDLVDYTHTLPEWEDPNGSSCPIDYDRLLEALGYDDEASGHLLDRLRVASSVST